uniref:BCL2 like 15 n=1 Tax=Crocodylus porosus TaxID=8502 RepID=A0A7M4F9Q3_CROPO
MKRSSTFEEQTECVVEALLSDLLGGKEEVAWRSLETDSTIRFDAVVIASRLRMLGDMCNQDLEGPAQQVITDMTSGKVEAFQAAVESLSRSWSSQNPELGYERALLSVSVKLGMYVAQKIPAVKEQLVELINGNRRVRGYIQNQGGWVSAEFPRAEGSAPSLGSSGHSLRGADSNSTVHWHSQRGAEPRPLVPCSSATCCSGCASWIGQWHC